MIEPELNETRKSKLAIHLPPTTIVFVWFTICIGRKRGKVRRLKKMTFIYFMHNQKSLTNEIILSHVEYLKQLKSEGKLILCGPFTDYPGGMVIFHAEDLNEATNIAENDPFIASGCKSYEIRTIELANEENNYLL